MNRNLASGGSGAPKIIEVMYRIYQLVVLVIVRVLTRAYKRCEEKCLEIKSTYVPCSINPILSWMPWMPPNPLPLS